MTTKYQLARELKGHESDVRSVCAYESVAGAVVTASRDNTARIWTPSEEGNYSQFRNLIGHTDYVTSVVYWGDNQIITGSHDKHIIVWDVNQGNPVNVISGHTGAVVSLFKQNTSNGPLLLSGSWDSTARVWKDGVCLHVLKGHTQNVLCVIGLENGDILTASGDRTIKRWSNGACIQTYQGHTDVARGLAEIPGLGFASCSNDMTVRIWALSGEKLMELVGHASLVFAICRLGSGELATASEDKTVKIWKDGECIQTIHHPGTVWDVKGLPNGDIVTACSDKVARVFTRSKVRVADEQTLKNYDDVIAQQQISTNLIGKVDVNKLPHISALEIPGTHEGEHKIVKSGNNAEVHQWTVADQKWVKIGDVVAAPEEQGGNNTLDGKKYDYVFDVDLPGGGGTGKLGYNTGENPYEAAQQFIYKYDLEQDFLEQIAQFIITNTPQNQPTFSAMDSDPFTGGSRYIPGREVQPTTGTQRQGEDLSAYSQYYRELLMQQLQGTSQPQQPKNVHYPINEVIVFDINKQTLTPLRNKFMEFNKAFQVENNVNALSSDEEKLFDEIISALNSGSGNLGPQHFSVLAKSLKWPAQNRFPVIDILRGLVLLGESTCNDLNAYFGGNLMQTILEATFGVDSYEILQRVGLNLIASTFKYTHKTLITAEQNFNMVMTKIALVQHSAAKFIPLLHATVCLNYCVKKSELSEQSRLALVRYQIETLKSSSDVEVTYRLLCALGTLVKGDSRLIAEARRFELHGSLTPYLQFAAGKLTEVSAHLGKDLQ